MISLQRFVSGSQEIVGDREFKGIAASSDLQPDGYALSIAGGDLSRFEGRGGPLLLMHDPAQLVGTIWLSRGSGAINFRAEFLPEGVSGDADQACKMLKAGAPYGMSLGFNILDSEWIDQRDPFGGRTATKWTALETSLVSVPMDSKAVITARAQAHIGLLSPRDQWEVERRRCVATFVAGRAHHDENRRRRLARVAQLEARGRQ